MAFYDGIGKKIKQTGQDTLTKGKNMTEIMRMKSRITELERTINTTYVDIGKLYFVKSEGTPQDEEMEPYFLKIGDCSKEIQNCQEQIRNLKGVDLCPQCGYEIDSNATFCNHCGAHLIPDVIMPTSGRRCPDCGSLIEEGQIFCIRCGCNLKEITDAEKKGKQCVQCGADLDENALFCTNCGQKVEEQTETNAHQEFVQDEEIVFSENSMVTDEKEPEATFCENCGMPIEAEEIFCSNCGHRNALN